jgi:hypothetical protein
MVLLLEAGCSRVGGVAQLGEHLLCKQGVIGSIPIVSTTRVCKANAPLPHRRCTASITCLQVMKAAPRIIRHRKPDRQASFGLYRGKSEFGVIMRVGKASCVVWPRRISGRPTVIVGRSRLFFGNVNQVLVRLWARVIRDLSLGGLRIPSFG